ncbi:MAG: glycosyltransferase family 4 protein [Chloroflexaceae bacterium]|jgi:glycosyltransferase involved in cell wall biosynthesis|nr:glycosyltransferase family 4 protein [Chloroflexaceae bacterium]
MRIAYVCTDPGVPVFGCKGSSIHVQEVLRAFLRQGAQVELFARRVDGPPPPGLEAVRLHQLPPLPKGDSAERERAALAANTAFHEALTAAGRFDLVYERYALWSFAAQEWANSQAIPSLLEVNAPLLTEQASYRSLHDVEGAYQATERAFAAAGAIAAVSEEVARYVETFPATLGKTHVVPNGVDPARFAPGLSPTLPAPADVFTVGFVGTLKPWHGLPTLIDAFAMLARQETPLRLLLVGDGPERAALQADLAQRGLSEKAHFTGAVPPTAVPGLLASMDVAVAPYPVLADFYFSPLKLYEYMAAGLPVVASRSGQIERVLRHCETGLLCAPGSATELAAALALLQRCRDLRQRLGRAARAEVERYHSWDAAAARLLHLGRSQQRAVHAER